MTSKIETRTYRSSVAIRSVKRDQDNGIGTLTGHAAVFNEVGHGYGFNEKILPGAFKKTIRRDDVRALWNHDHSLVLGRKESGTLSLREDKKGLAVSIALPDTQTGRDALELVSRGDVTGMSFGFQIVDEEWGHDADGDEVRTIKEVKLFEVSPCAFPFYEGTDISGKKARTKPETKAERGEWLKKQRKELGIRIASGEPDTARITAARGRELELLRLKSGV